MKLFSKKRDGSVSIGHYAPDITLTAIDYYPPVSHEERIQRAEKRIKEFLEHTNPDSLCDSFYDRIADEDEHLIIALLRKQIPNHKDANGSIALKHQAELTRLVRAIQLVDAEIIRMESEINDLQVLYDHFNGSRYNT